MKTNLLCTTIILCVMSLSGCAASGGGTAKSDKVVRPETVTLECRSALRQGCRYQSQILPWDAWVETLGYSNEKYAITEIKHSGSKAVVTVKSR